MVDWEGIYIAVNRLNSHWKHRLNFDAILAECNHIGFECLSSVLNLALVTTFISRFH